MNIYIVSIGSGSREIKADTIENAFKSLGHKTNDFKIKKNGLKNWIIVLKGSPGHERVYTVKQIN